MSPPIASAMRSASSDLPVPVGPAITMGSIGAECIDSQSSPPNHPPHTVNTNHRPAPLQQDEAVLPHVDRGHAQTESADQIQHLIRFRLRFEVLELLRRECGQNQNRSNHRCNLKDHDEK